MPTNTAAPKENATVLLLEGVNDSAIELFVSSGLSNIERLPKALDASALLQAVGGVDLLGIRSRTQLTWDILSRADRLAAVGCFSVGTNQVDLNAARQRRHSGLQRSILEYPQRRGTGNRRNRHAASSHSSALGDGS